MVICFHLFSQKTDSLRILSQIDSLTKRGAELGKNKLFHEALQVYQDIAELSRSNFGDGHRTHYMALNGKGIMYTNLRKFDDAISTFEKALQIIENSLGKETKDYVQILYNQYVAYKNLRDIAKVELTLKELARISEKVFGYESQENARALYALAVFNYEMTRYDEAEPFHISALQIRRKVLGNEHILVSYSLSSLGKLYLETSQYPKAEPLLLEALKIAEKNEGKESFNFALYMADLGTLYYYTRNYQKAENHFIHSLKLFEKLSGKLSQVYVSMSSGLGAIYNELHEYDKALAHLSEAIELTEKLYGKQNGANAGNLVNLGISYFNLGQLDKAMDYFNEAMALYKREFGEVNVHLADTYTNLGHLLASKAQYSAADSFFIKAKFMYEQTVGIRHSSYLENLSHTINLNWKIGEYAKVSKYTLLLDSLEKKFIHDASFHLSEVELAQYIHKFKLNFERSLSFIQKIPSLTPLCFDNILHYKGYLLNISRVIQNLATRDSNATVKLNMLKDLRKGIARQLTKPHESRDSGLLSKLELQANDLEKELSRDVSQFKEAIHPVKWHDISKVLKPGDAVIEFVHFTSHEQNLIKKYGAILLVYGAVEPVYIELCNEKSLHDLMRPHHHPDSHSNLYVSRGASPLNQSGFFDLYDLIWKPLSGYLNFTKRVYYSSSGLLHYVNFEAIPGTQRTLLQDQFEFIRLNSCRSLLKISDANERNNRYIVLYGGIDYNLDSTDLNLRKGLPSEDLYKEDNAFTFNSTLRNISDIDMSWNYLPGTADEVKGIENLTAQTNLQCKIVSGSSATEESFKALGNSEQSPYILHIATHGFFFPEQQDSSEKSIFRSSDHPMVRTGLILAGGNFAWSTGTEYKPGMEDGILTAYEVSHLNFSNTELVVLSACETGLGDIKGDEGVYGLQRAFKMAGAKYLMISLWKVPDKETKEFMILFYKNWLKKKKNIREAFRKTQREMRERYMSPNAWAGFVLIE